MIHPGTGTPHARVDSFLAAGLGQALPDFVDVDGNKIKLDMNMFKRELAKGRQNTLTNAETYNGATSMADFMTWYNSEEGKKNPERDRFKKEATEFFGVK